MKTRTSDVYSEIDNLDKLDGPVELSHVDKQKRDLLKFNLANCLHREAITWKQKVREK